MSPDVWIVFLAALLTAVATGLGALPFLLVRDVGPRTISLANAVAAGLMLAACHGLIAEGIALSAPRLLVGLVIGLAAIVLGQRLADRHAAHEAEPDHGPQAAHHHHAHHHAHDDAHHHARHHVHPQGHGHHVIPRPGDLTSRKAFLIMAVMTAHSFAEGIGVGVSFADTTELATFVTAAIAVHNIPEGLAISLVLVPRGVSVLKAGLWSIFSSLPQPLMAVPAFLFVTAFKPLLPVGLGLAAGAMMWMVFAELVPDANKNASPGATAVTMTLAFTAMLAFQYLVLKH